MIIIDASSVLRQNTNFSIFICLFSGPQTIGIPCWHELIYDKLKITALYLLMREILKPNDKDQGKKAVGQKLDLMAYQMRTTNSCFQHIPLQLIITLYQPAIQNQKGLYSFCHSFMVCFLVLFSLSSKIVIWVSAVLLTIFIRSLVS